MIDKIKKYVHLKGVVTLIIVVSIIALLAVFYDHLVYCVEAVIKQYSRIIFWTILICSGIGIAHAMTKRTKETNTFFLRFISSPFLAAIFTAVTYGVVINACLALLYIVNYDSDLMVKYPSIDRISISATIILLLVAAVMGQIKMIWEIITPPQTTAITERAEQQQEENKED